MKRLRLDGPLNIVLKEGDEEIRPGQEFDVTDDRAKALLQTKGLHLSAVKKGKETEPADDGTDEGGTHGTV
jgi:hypothetical protein